MAEVVAGSTQHQGSADLAAMATYLKELPVRTTTIVAIYAPATSEAGRKLYERHCSGCHGEQGQGVAGAYRALTGNRAVLLTPAANLVHVVLRGGFPPTAAGNPRPFGMPPFATVMTDSEVASAISYGRGAWANRPAPVSTLEVARFHGSAR